jgi:pyroglutamyl-peptidase
VQPSALLIGFEPYGGLDRNPSAEVVKELDGTVIAHHGVDGRVLPVSFGSLGGRIRELLSDTDPAVVVSLGLCPGEPVIRLERVALNLADFAIPDNEGSRIQDAPVTPAGPAARLATLPLRGIERALLRAGIPVRLSATAGTFLCNATLYTTLETVRPGVPCGFVHLPYLPEQAARRCAQTNADPSALAAVASMSAATMVAAVRIVLEVSLREGHAL